MGKRDRRRAKRARPVDGRAAPHATALQNRDRFVVGFTRGGFLIQIRIRFGLTHPEIAR